MRRRPNRGARRPCGPERGRAVTRGPARLRDMTRRAPPTLADIVERSADVLSRHAPDGTYLYVSPACERIYGRTAEQMQGRHPLEFVHPDDLAHVHQVVHSALNDGAGFEVEHRVLRPDGSVAWVHAIIVHDPATLVGFGDARDITSQRVTQAALARAQEDMRVVTELSRDLLTRTTPDGTILYASPASARHLGIAPARLVGRKVREFTDAADHERFEAAVQRLHDGADEAELEYRLVQPDGGRAWLHVLLYPRRDERGRLVEIVRCARDITARKHVEARLGELTGQLEGAFERAPIGMALVSLDGQYLRVNEALCAMLGRGARELTGAAVADITLPCDYERDRDGFAQLKAGLIERYECEKRYLHASGHEVWVALSASVVHDEHGAPLYMVAKMQDITERKAREAQLAEAMQLFAGAFEFAPIGMSLLSPDGRWLKVNQALCDITGYSAAQLLAMTFRDITHPDDNSISTEGLSDLLAGGRAVWDCEKRYVHASGRVIWVAVSSSVVRGERGEPRYIIAQTRDVTEAKELKEHLVHLAERDPLTGLYNRRRFEAELERQVGLSRRYGDHAALMLLDLDHFKYLNDSLGHAVGDQVIKHFSSLLSGRLRRTDLLARLGGDEFAIIALRADVAAAMHLAAALVDLVKHNPFVCGENEYRLSTSVGVVMLNADSPCAGDALIAADVALYDAKQRGRSRAALYALERRERVLDGLSWCQRLREALVSDGFELHTQPVVDLATGELAFSELLIRMRSRSGELLAPGQFLPAAVRLGYMPAIDRLVIAKAAAFAAAAPGRRLSVNVTARTLAEGDITAYITRTLTDAGANPADLIFELSENDIIANLDQARETCAALRELGAAVALDDFGAGFSGFSYLKALTVDMLKIDGQFIKGLAGPDNALDRLVVKAVLDVAHGLSLPSVAEYVADEATAQACRELGICYGQGFHLGRPAPMM